MLIIKLKLPKDCSNYKSMITYSSHFQILKKSITIVYTMLIFKLKMLIAPIMKLWLHIQAISRSYFPATYCNNIYGQSVFDMWKYYPLLEQHTYKKKKSPLLAKIKIDIPLCFAGGNFVLS